MKVKELIEKLKLYPEDADWHAYEGEDCGVTIIIRHENGKSEYFFISDRPPKVSP